MHDIRRSDAAVVVSSLIGRVLPPHVAAAEALADATAEPLFPEEAEVVARAVDKRRREFTSGRRCARRALALLGIPAVSVPRGAEGAPHWPLGVVGSITHCDGYCAAAVARASRIAALGIDAEPHEALPSGVLDLIALPGEQERLSKLAGYAYEIWGRLLFSAKESVYKAWFPLTQRRLSFLDVDISIDPSGGTFAASLPATANTPSDRPMNMFGRWVIHNGVIATASAVPEPNTRH
jgi:4'-phosphopantetheinyl transferase EntD